VLIPVGIVVLLIGGSAVGAYGYDQASSDRILPGVRVAGVNVGNMTRAEAIRAVAGKAHLRLAKTIRITAGERRYRLSYGDLGVRADVAGAIDQAFAVSDSLSFISRVYHRLMHSPVERHIRLTLTYDGAEARDFVQKVSDKVFHPAQSAAIKWEDNSIVFQHSETGKALAVTPNTGRLLQALRAGQNRAHLFMRTVEPAVSDDTLGDTLTVNVSTNTLQLYDGFNVIRTYPVATAMQGFSTPVGTWEVVNKVENPSWINPCLGEPGCWAASEPAVIPPGPDNPLGTRALYLNAPGIRIHGTPSDDSIGTYASHGCIRMHIPDSEALYPLVPIRTPVLIYGSPPWGNGGESGVAGP
jgi:lipoprotein-anchoring transpeptidase ErfK/SrfK